MLTSFPRDEALIRLKLLVNQDLRPLADYYNVTVFKPGGGLNKGWVGQVIERYLGLPINSFQRPDFGDWELKCVSLKYLRNGTLVLKETMAITMLEPQNIAQTPFEESYLYHKLRRMIVCGRIFADKQESSAILYNVEAFDFDDHEDQELIEQIKKDYNLVRDHLRAASSPAQGFSSLSGKMGIYIQPRTKGRGHGSTSRAFYMRKNALAKLLKLDA